MYLPFGLLAAGLIISEKLRYFINGPEELPPKTYRQPAPDGGRYTNAFKFIERTGLRFTEGPENKYSVSHDRLYIRPPEMFGTYGHYLSTVFHEMGHWTGPRLGRPMPRKGEPGYPEEEVIAEICSMHLCYCLYLEELHPDLGHKAYITRWAQHFDEPTFSRCVDEGMRASKYLRGLGRLADRK
jgi:antirestriction protein ArdC